MIVAGLVIVLMLASLAFAPFAAVAALPFLVWLWTGYIVADTLLVFRWRHDLLRSWQDGRINLGVFANGVRTLSVLPRSTIESLLLGLPILPPLRDRDLAASERAVVAAFSDWCWSVEAAAALLPGVLIGLPAAFAAILLLTATVPNAATVGAAMALMAAAFAARFGWPARSRRRLARELAGMAPNARAAVMQIAREAGCRRTS